MIAAILAAALAATPAPATPAGALVGPCIWSKLPADHKALLLAAPDFAAFDKLRRGYPEGATETAFAACVPENDGPGDASAEIAFTYYEASLWAERRVLGKWPQSKLAAIDSMPEDDLQYFWLQPDPKAVGPAYLEQRARVWSRVYGAFGRTGPSADKGDPLDAWIVARVGWRLGESNYRKSLKPVVLPVR
jgi:hypothetical protein